MKSSALVGVATKNLLSQSRGFDLEKIALSLLWNGLHAWKGRLEKKNTGRSTVEKGIGNS